MGKKKEKEGVESAVGLRGSCKFTIGVPPERGEESWYIIKGGSRDSAEVRTMVKKIKASLLLLLSPGETKFILMRLLRPFLLLSLFDSQPLESFEPRRGEEK